LAVLPTTVLPKFTLPGVAAKVAPAATPVPTKVSDCCAPDALSVNAMDPEDAPATVGAN